MDNPVITTTPPAYMSLAWQHRRTTLAVVLGTLCLLRGLWMLLRFRPTVLVPREEAVKMDAVVVASELVDGSDGRREGRIDVEFEWDGQTVRLHERVAFTNETERQGFLQTWAPGTRHPVWYQRRARHQWFHSHSPCSLEQIGVPLVAPSQDAWTVGMGGLLLGAGAVGLAALGAAWWTSLRSTAGVAPTPTPVTTPTMGDATRTSRKPWP